MSRSPSYDPSIIEQAAERLNGKARATLLGSVFVGLSLGGALGVVPLTSLGSQWPVPHSFGFATALAGTLIGALIGYVVGSARAFGHRLQAQVALSQLQLERNTALVAQAFQALANARSRAPERPAAATPPSAPPPTSPPPPEPATVPPRSEPPVGAPPSIAPPSVAPPPLAPPPAMPQSAAQA